MGLLLTPVGAVGVFVILCGLVLAALRSRRSRLVALPVLLVVGLVAGVFWSWSVEVSPWETATVVDDRTLSLAYVAGSCETTRSVEVHEDDLEVRLTLRTLTLATACDDMANAGRVRVQLDRPLAGRVLVDGACDLDPFVGACTAAATRGKATPAPATD